MKNHLLVLITCCFLGVTTTQAQDQKFHFGLKVSPTLAWLKSDAQDLKKNGSKLGFSYGIMTEFNFQQNYSFASGLQVTYRGGKLKDSDGNNHNISLKYIEIPFTLKMKTNELVDKFKFFGQFGIVPGLNITAKDGDTDIKNGAGGQGGIRALNAAMLIAIGTEYTVSGSTVLMGSLEFNNGFTDVSKDPGAIMTNFVALNIGVLF